MISPAEREFVIEQLDQTRDALLRLLRGLSRDQLLYRPDPERWSIAENVEHLLVVEKRLVGAIEKVLQDSPDLSRCCAMSDAGVLHIVSKVEQPMQSPVHSLPKSRWPAETLVQEFAAARQCTRDFTNTVNGDLRRHFFPHPFFGDFDCYQWLLLIGAHCHRHTTQSEAVRNSSSFPNEQAITA
jgi:hypothetical protein